MWIKISLFKIILKIIVQKVNLMGTADKMYFKTLISENDLDEPK